MRKPKRNQRADTDNVSNRDRCQTPDYALDPLLSYLSPEWVIWEPARGEGYIERTLVAAGMQVVASDLLTGQNYFLNSAQPEAWDVQVTNPPFSVKYRWLNRAYVLGKPFALLMPVDTTGAGSAQRLFKAYGIEILYMDKRIDFGMPNKGFDGSGAQFASAWFTWGLNIGRQMTFVTIEKRKQEKMDPLNPHQVKLEKQLQLF